jgi:hypothetical protein
MVLFSQVTTLVKRKKRNRVRWSNKEFNCLRRCRTISNLSQRKSRKTRLLKRGSWTGILDLKIYTIITDRFWILNLIFISIVNRREVTLTVWRYSLCWLWCFWLSISLMNKSALQSHTGMLTLTSQFWKMNSTELKILKIYGTFSQSSSIKSFTLNLQTIISLRTLTCDHLSCRISIKLIMYSLQRLYKLHPWLDKCAQFRKELNLPPAKERSLLIVILNTWHKKIKRWVRLLTGILKVTSAWSGQLISIWKIILKRINMIITWVGFRIITKIFQNPKERQ